MSIILRSEKGSALTHTEMDNNIVELRDGLNLMLPKDKTSGIKTDSLGTPSFAWHDLLGELSIDPVFSPSNAVYQQFIGGIKAFQFTEGSDAYVRFHIPHDYLMGSDLFIHVHWMHNSTFVTGGSVTWVMESTYAKGHNLGAFTETKLISVVQAASPIQFQHLVAETSLSITGGSSVQLDSSLIEPDGIVLCRLYLDSNDITVSEGVKPDPFALFTDIHYQSTNIGTKQRIPDFWT